jgi:PilZ domain
MTLTSNSNYGAERRRHPRVNADVQVEIRTNASQAPSHVVAKDISLCGCYVETMFTLETGTKVSLTLWLGEKRISAAAMVVTRHPQVGNGFEFIDMVPEDRLELNALISTVEGAHSPSP